jgi:hypothetical protein
MISSISKYMALFSGLSSMYLSILPISPPRIYDYLLYPYVPSTYLQVILVSRLHTPYRLCSFQGTGDGHTNERRETVHNLFDPFMIVNPNIKGNGAEGKTYSQHFRNGDFLRFRHLVAQLCESGDE